MKKMLRIFVILIFLNVFSQAAFSISLEQGKQAFHAYVKESNACSIAFINMYDKNSVIKRIITNANGTTYTKIIPTTAYKTMLVGYSKAALLNGYRNNYTNISFQQVGNDVVVKATRHPSTSTQKLPATIIFTENSKGKIVIKEEAFYTNAGFLIK